MNKWINPQHQLPKPNSDCLVQIKNHKTYQVFFTCFDRDNPFIKEHDKKKFWLYDDCGNSLDHPFGIEDISGWIYAPKDWHTLE
jgi:hypothetical protein